MKLIPELVPQTAWYSNLRKMLKPADWDILRRRQYSLANNVCEICGDSGKNQGYRYSLECHEIWNYDDVNTLPRETFGDNTHAQTLVGLIGLCPRCHQVIHFGLTQAIGKEDIAIQHMRHVNGCTKDEAYEIVRDAFELWQKRSRVQWHTDISWLDSQGIILSGKM